MPAKSYELHGTPVYECAAEGNRLRNDRDAVDVMSEAWGHNAALLVIPVERLDDDFFRLSTGVAGAIIQKFVNYRVAIVGDISRHLAESSSLRAFVYEANRGSYLWFAPTVEELDQRMQSLQVQTESL